MNDNEKDVSSIPTDNTKLYLARSKQQVRNLKLDNQKNQKKMKKLTEQINVVNRDLRKEKKVANALLETRRKEYAEVLTTNKALICDTQTMKKTIEDIKAKEKVDILIVEREVRILYSKKLKHANEKLARRK